MGATRKLREHLTGLLKTKCPRVYYLEANKKAAVPYIVFDLAGVEGEDHTQYQLEIDVWDRGATPARVEDLADDVKKALHRYTHLDEDMLIKSYLSARDSLPDEDPTIKRRRLVFELTHYERRINNA